MNVSSMYLMMYSFFSFLSSRGAPLNLNLKILVKWKTNGDKTMIDRSKVGTFFYGFIWR